MFLKSLEIKNFRKFYHDATIGSKHNITFANSANFRCESGNLNVAEKTTLIVGQNNSGKTTIVKALEALLKETPNFNEYDFNIQMLDEIFKTYTLESLSSDEKDGLRMPEIEFVMVIGLDNPNDLITNVAQFLRLSDVGEKEIKIIAKWEVKEKEEFLHKIEDVLQNVEKFKEISNEEEIYKAKKYNDLSKLLYSNNFQLNFYNEEQEKVENFKIYNLIEIVAIKANKVDSDKCLSTALKKIIDFRHKNRTDANDVADAENKLFKAGCDATANIKNLHVSDISKSLGRITAQNVAVSVRADLTLTNLMNTLIKCEYLEGNKPIPENQYGLGYTNLIMIISEIISYIDRYHLDTRNSKVHIISIEEPETYMHPQMQELFIKHINDTIKELLKKTDKYINSQLIITTHSANILNS
ncbi:MAG: ATP-binding protein, partial [Alphaproteobacteria bacterium]|nr:ATP-binding protein [Alphaproteobacteria bacterium]